MKVGDLVKWKALNGEPLVGVIVGFDCENDPQVKSCKSGIVVAHWRSSLEIINEKSKDWRFGETP